MIPPWAIWRMCCGSPPSGISGGIDVGGLAMQTKTLTIQLNNEQLPILPVEPEAYLSFTTHADGNELELTGNRAGLLLLAKAALGMAETLREDGFHIHLDDLYGINAEGKSILIRKEERSEP